MDFMDPEVRAAHAANEEKLFLLMHHLHKDKEHLDMLCQGIAVVHVAYGGEARSAPVDDSQESCSRWVSSMMAVLAGFCLTDFMIDEEVHERNYKAHQQNVGNAAIAAGLRAMLPRADSLSKKEQRCRQRYYMGVISDLILTDGGKPLAKFLMDLSSFSYSGQELPSPEEFQKKLMASLFFEPEMFCFVARLAMDQIVEAAHDFLKSSAASGN